MVIIEWFRLWIRQQETRRKPPILKMFSQFCRSSSAFSFPFCCYAPTDRSDFVVAWVLFVCFYIYGWLPPFCIGFNKWAWLFTVTQHLTRRQIASTCALHFQIHFKFFWMGNLMISFKKKNCCLWIQLTLYPTSINVVCSLSVLLFMKFRVFVFTGGH